VHDQLWQKSLWKGTPEILISKVPATDDSPVVIDR
jgi:hypothetical protein